MKILFQGDSITDAGRDRSNPHDLGPGYPKYAAQYIQEQHPNKMFEFVNLGISGDQTKDLLARWKTDCVDIQPDLVSIHIGVNDTWHHAPKRDWLLDAQFENNYRSILTDIRTKTNAKIMILEQFLLPVPDKEFFRIDLDAKIGITRKLAREFADIFVPVDGLFAAACVEKDMLHWSADGVHPNENGSAFMGKLYAEAFMKLFG
ncbi:MAG TPA: SGNH/GDSL hydrolase family protein [Oscillospiraceae bacterium]|nr:SGNH/GDSL hydrolase family protein [Oscillospiraceae bacterium]HPS34845.1 SGNH/GDSL hydrolase family protein [Oscillospiraceae bacterium]